MIADAGTAPDAASAVTAQDGAACRRLWRSVLAQAILEAARDARARDWLRTADARLVADLAGVDAAMLRRVNDATRTSPQRTSAEPLCSPHSTNMDIMGLCCTTKRTTMDGS